MIALYQVIVFLYNDLSAVNNMLIIISPGICTEIGLHDIIGLYEKDNKSTI